VRICFRFLFSLLHIIQVLELDCTFSVAILFNTYWKIQSPIFYKSYFFFKKTDFGRIFVYIFEMRMI